MDEEKLREIDESVLKFLCNLYFQDEQCMIKRASKRAYLDLCRTIRFTKESTGNNRSEELVDKVGNYFINNIKESLTPQAYNKWHEQACCSIIDISKKSKLIQDEEGLSYGQAQKWVNMTMKYLYVLNQCYGSNQNKYDYLEKVDHMPIDNIILKKIYHKKWTGTSWSRFNKTEYEEHLKKAQGNLGDIKSLFLWELKNWKN